MSKSPWAKRVTVVFPRPPGDGGGGGAGAVPVAGGAPGADRGGGPIRTSAQTRLVVQWRSALPVRQALVRSQIGPEGTVEPEAQELLNRSVPAYYVVVSGVPRQFGRLTPEALMVEARLERKGKSQIAAVQVRPTGGWAGRCARLRLSQGRCHRAGRQGRRIRCEGRGHDDQEKVQARGHGVQRPARAVTDRFSPPRPRVTVPIQGCEPCVGSTSAFSDTG